jgi:hypothetical protein
MRENMKEPGKILPTAGLSPIIPYDGDEEKLALVAEPYE